MASVRRHLSQQAGTGRLRKLWGSMKELMPCLPCVVRHRGCHALIVSITVCWCMVGSGHEVGGGRVSMCVHACRFVFLHLLVVLGAGAGVSSQG